MSGSGVVVVVVAGVVFVVVVVAAASAVSAFAVPVVSAAFVLLKVLLRFEPGR